MICKILGLFVNTLTANDKHSLLRMDKAIELEKVSLSEMQKLRTVF